MKKQFFALIAVLCIAVSLSACVEQSDEDNASFIRNYLTEHSSYGFERLEVMLIDDPSLTRADREIWSGDVRITATMDNNSIIEDFALFTREVVELSEIAVNEKGLSIYYVNTILRLEGVGHVGWDTNGRLYDRHGTISENVSIDDLESEIVSAMDRRSHEPPPSVTPSPEPSVEPSPELARTVYWVANGDVYHSSRNCRSLARSSNIRSGTIEQSGKSRACSLC